MKANGKTPRTGNLKKRATAAAAVISAGLIVMMLLMFSCTSTTPANDADSVAASDIVQLQNEDNSSKREQNDMVPESGTGIEADEASDATATEQAADVQNPSHGAEVSSPPSHTSTSGHAASSSGSAPTQPQKTWVEEKERVWVVDKEAWTERVPIYSTVEVSICNICGADITGNTSAHSKEHMKAGEGSGHHSEVRQEITGYETVSHKEEGHYETRVSSGHWK